MRLKLSSIHLEPGYRELMTNCFEELNELSNGLINAEFPTPFATLFVSSPNEVTPYHIDSELNYLTHIYGTKTVYLFDGTDSTLIDTEKIERYWGGGGIQLPEEFTSKGVPFELKPGTGVQHPVHFPHWVQNGPTPSVSVSISFLMRHEPSEVLRVNYYLRRIGLSPRPPGQIELVDNLKRSVARGIRFAKNTLKGMKPPKVKIR